MGAASREEVKTKESVFNPPVLQLQTSHVRQGSSTKVSANLSVVAGGQK